MLSFTTVVYSKDYPLLELQAMSFARFVDPASVASIHVIMNDIDEPGLRAKIEPLMDAYGPLKSKVELISGDDVLLGADHCARRTVMDQLLIENRYRIPGIRKGGWRGNNGYRMQQVLKMGAARVAASEHMVILDAKNVFLRTFEESEFFSPSGAARIPFIGIQTDFHKRWLCESLDALNVPHPNLSQLQTTTFSTPFPVCRSLVLALLDEINERYGSVQSLYGSRRRPSEFMLMNAFCLKSPEGYGPWFERATNWNVGLWPSYSAEKLASQVAQLDHPSSLSLGLHNRALSILPGDLRDRLFQELETRGVCERSHAEDVLIRTATLTG